jgi:hypothetical protein
MTKSKVKIKTIQNNKKTTIMMGKNVRMKIKDKMI